MMFKNCSKHDYFLQKDAKRSSFLTKKRKKTQKTEFQPLLSDTLLS